ncbi:MAG: enoyl-CoA hydratase/isomerase family protein [Desulfosporosinus sp.]|nr:enoyl-CoA hydratase/isomerase family protein [Desulfosporosinus sp.]
MRVLIRRESIGKITLQETAKIAIITIERSTKRNALTANMWSELARLGKIAEANPKNRVVILRGRPGQFTAGSDINDFCNMSSDEANSAFAKMEEAIQTFESLSLPVIGVIDGPAMGAGFILSLACDIRIGTENTKMGIPVGCLGIRLAPSFVRRIVKFIGPSRTKELVYTGKIYNYLEAQHLGLLNFVIEKNVKPKDFYLKLAQTISKQSLASLKAVKKSVELCEWKQDLPWNFVDPEDFHEGCLAFKEKRTPNFTKKNV